MFDNCSVVFHPIGPSSESTDTASEVGSCFSSPSSSTLGNSAQNSPNVSGRNKILPKCWFALPPTAWLSGTPWSLHLTSFKK